MTKITDKEVFEGEEECPVYGEEFPEWYCKGCSLGMDGTAICPFRKMAYQQGEN